jgi:hypothetical protein
MTDIISAIPGVSNTDTGGARSVVDYLAAPRAETDSTGLSQSKYDFNYKVFPEDLASNFQGHYMIININVPVTPFVSDPGGRGYYSRSGPLIGSTRQDFTSTILPNELSKTDALRYANAERFTGISEERTAFTLKRSTRRIAESIALFMPGPLIFTTENNYEEISLTAIGGQYGKMGAVAAAIGITGVLTRRRRAAIRGGEAARSFLDAAGNVLRQTASLGGFPINPKVEVLFAATPQRQFVMDWLLAPKNERESDTIRNIVQTLRYHAAPELGLGTNTVFDNLPFFIPPAEFDITFYNKGRENLNMPRINTCVLERIEVQYDPSGIYSTFRNGHPVAVKLQMAFRETEIIHKTRVLQGF